MATAINGVLAAGTRAPAFRLPRAGGGDIALPDAAAKGLTLVVFYKNSCPTCQLTLPILQRLHEQVEPFGGRVVAVAQDDLDAAGLFAREYGLSLPVVADGDGWPVSSAYDLVSVPTLYLLDRDGIVVRGSTGFHKSDLAQVAADLAASVGAPPPAIYRDGEVLPDLKPG